MRPGPQIVWVGDASVARSGHDQADLRRRRVHRRSVSRQSGGGRAARARRRARRRVDAAGRRRDEALGDGVRAPRGDGGFDLRWFTPEVEVDLCGHATLAERARALRDRPARARRGRGVPHPQRRAAGHARAATARCSSTSPPRRPSRATRPTGLSTRSASPTAESLRTTASSSCSSSRRRDRARRSRPTSRALARAHRRARRLRDRARRRRATTSCRGASRPGSGSTKTRSPDRCTACSRRTGASASARRAARVPGVRRGGEVTRAPATATARCSPARGHDRARGRAPRLRRVTRCHASCARDAVAQATPPAPSRAARRARSIAPPLRNESPAIVGPRVDLDRRARELADELDELGERDLSAAREVAVRTGRDVARRPRRGCRATMSPTYVNSRICVPSP